MLRGRAAECERIDGLLGRARDGVSGVLVLRGDAGIGKTALLEHAAATAAPGTTVLKARGVESELELAFAGLNELLAPVAREIGRLPSPQAAALQAALGLQADAAADAGTAYLVGAGLVALL